MLAFFLFLRIKKSNIVKLRERKKKKTENPKVLMHWPNIIHSGTGIVSKKKFNLFSNLQPRFIFKFFENKHELTD
jgi:hypothetical protein